MTPRSNLISFLLSEIEFVRAGRVASSRVLKKPTRQLSDTELVPLEAPIYSCQSASALPEQNIYRVFRRKGTYFRYEKMKWNRLM